MPFVNKNLPLPAYHQLADMLREMIRQAAPSDGAPFMLPSETELSSQHRITRATVRQALDVLEREGLVYREKGKGTFATRPRNRYELTQLIPTTDDIIRRGWTPGVHVISAQEVAAPSAVIAALGLNAGEAVFELCRVRLGNGEPLCLQWSYLPARLCPDLLTRDLSQSLSHLLETAYNLYFWSAHELLRARLATEDEAKLLAIPAWSAVIHMERTTFSAERQPLEFLRTVWRSDRYDFEFQLTRRR
jgi:GntR family transcriptional regulator